MGFWPFGGGKKGRQNIHEQTKETLIEKNYTDTMPRHTKAAERALRGDGRGGQDEKSRRLSKTKQQTQKYSPNNATTRSQPVLSIPGRYDGNSEKQITSSPSDRVLQDRMYRQSPMSQTSIGPEDFSAVAQPPTLLAKRRDYDSGVSRHKSSKRKAEDHAREQEIRAMSSPRSGPRRPASYSGSGPLLRDTKQIPGDLNRRLQRPTSEISLPKPESMGEAEDISNQNSFKIGLFAALSPRPTLRYDANPRSAAGKQVARPRPFLNDPIEEEEISPKARINELADDLDAGGLRELMERDRKRREKKKDADRAKLQRKLQRRAERQNEDDTRRQKNEKKVENEVPRRDQPVYFPGIENMVGDESSIDKTASAHDQEESSSPANPFADPKPEEVQSSQAIRNPFEDEKDIDVMREPSEHGEEEPPIPVRSPLRTVSATARSTEPQASQATVSPSTSPIPSAIEGQDLSQTSQLPKDTNLDVPETTPVDRRASDQSNQQVGGWTNFFKRGGKRKPSGSEQGRVTPSEFSNTSRESFSRKQPPPIIPPRSYRRSDSSNTPQRTLSKFREDLPEYPISPPDSRVQSPEIPSSSAQLPLSQRSSRQPERTASGNFDTSSSVAGSSSIGFERGRPDSQLQFQRSMDLATAGTTTSEGTIPQSLASVDSEATWLSGKPTKRLSAATNMSTKPNEQETSPQPPGGFANEEDEFVDDEYLSRLSPSPDNRRESTVSGGRKASSTIIDLQREHESSPVPEMPSKQGTDDGTWHQGVARQATIVRQANRAKSKEGLLKEYEGEDIVSSGAEDDGDTQDMESPDPEIHDTPILRAQSVEYRGHARHISAGSAKLLDIRRSSIQANSVPQSPVVAQTPTISQPNEPEPSKN